MAQRTEKPRISPLVLLSVFLSLLAVALSSTALLMVYDRTHTWKTARDRLGVRSVSYNWPGHIDRAERYLKSLREQIGLREAADSDQVQQTLDGLTNELNRWVQAAGPRLRDAAEELSKMGGEVRDSLKEGGEVAAEKLKALGEAIGRFRDRVEGKTKESPSDE